MPRFLQGLRLPLVLQSPPVLLGLLARQLLREHLSVQSNQRLAQSVQALSKLAP
jgi:hypothetical protein